MLSESLLAVIAQKLLPNKNKNGRVAACEIMIANSAVRNLIREDKILTVVVGDPNKSTSKYLY